MANTLSTYTLRDKYFKSSLETALRNALVAESICRVDRSDLKRIQNPYITKQTAAIQAVAGTYSVSAMTTTDDALTVSEEIIFGTHVFDFETVTSNFNLTADFLDDLANSVMEKTDEYVLNKLLDDAGASYTAPAGGFTTAANIPVIFSNLISKVGGYRAGTANDMFVVIENTDLVGLTQAQVASGFNYADMALNNGMVGAYAGVRIYVIRSGTFKTATIGTLTATNANHRLFGIRNVATWAAPRGMRYEEKGVSGKTGVEVVAYMYTGAKVWTPKANLFVDIDVSA